MLLESKRIGEDPGTSVHPSNWLTDFIISFQVLSLVADSM
jgi:hypothetical protein